VQKLRDNVVQAIRSHMAAGGHSAEDVFKQICGNKLSSDMTSEQFIDFVGSSANLPDLELEASQASKLFEHLSGGESSIDLERFNGFLQYFFKVMKSTMLTKDFPINSKVSCRLDAGDLLELLEGPTKDEKVGITRVRCRSLAKKGEGWATMAGNHGTVFLQPLAWLYHCAKEAALTDVLTIQGSKTIRNLDAGEVVEALGAEEWDAGCRVSRLKCKAQKDGAIGYVTISGNQGMTFLLPC